MKNKSLTILLLEDDHALAMVLVKAMIKREHQCVHAENITQFLQSLTMPHIDLIIMDLKLEQSSSLSSIAHARATHPAAKIIMVTGFASIATTVEAIKQGADDYLPKPVTVDDILRIYFNDTEQADIEDVRLSPKRVEWEHIQRVLQDNDGNISRTAEQLSMHRRTLQRKLQKKPQ